MKYSEFPRQDRVEGFFSPELAGLRVNDLSLSEVYHTLLFAASHRHTARISSYAKQLNDVRKACVGNGAAELDVRGDPARSICSPYIGSVLPSLRTSPLVNLSATSCSWQLSHLRTHAA